MLFALAACGGAPGDPDRADALAVDAPREKVPLAFFSSLPILWGEGDITDLLSDSAEPHWARVMLERDYALQPVDRLTTLDSAQKLVMAQPRALAPDENVALDAWVRGGGQLLLFVDPMLTEHSEYGLGDKRRPATLSMLSPILARWGLALELAAAGSEGGDAVDWDGTAIPVAVPGRLLQTGAGFESACAIEAQALVADCRIGDGRALIVADAALLEAGHDDHHDHHDHGDHEAGESGHAANESALRALLTAAFGGA